MLLVLLACPGGYDTPKTSTGSTTQVATTATTAGGTTVGTTTASTGPAPDAPAITSCEATCTQHTTGEDYYQWALECTATDPQGLADIANGRFIVFTTDPDAPLAQDLVACAPGTGQCTAAFAEDQYGVTISCLDAGDYTLRTWVSDWEGHESAPYDTQGLYVP